MLPLLATRRAMTTGTLHHVRHTLTFPSRHYYTYCLTTRLDHYFQQQLLDAQ